MEQRERAIQKNGKENGKTEDPRVVSLILFQKLQKELNDLDDELTEKVALRILSEALDLIPDLVISPGSRPNEITVSHTRNPETKKVLNLQDAADSLLTVWRDYQKVMEQT